jgi:non-ribosomal peptide synthetase component F
VSYIRSYIIESTDIILHHTSVSFDSHFEEITGSLIQGAQVVVLKPDPYHLDMNYFSRTIQRYHISYLGSVPTVLIMLIDNLRILPKDQQYTRLKSLRRFSLGGLSLIKNDVLI